MVQAVKLLDKILTTDKPTAAGGKAGQRVGHEVPPEHYLTHTPAHPGCKVCMLANMAAAPEPRGKPEVEERVVDEVKDDNVLVQGIAGDKYALGFFGYAYYIENTDKLKIAPIDGGNGPQIPTAETINTGAYSPLSRPLFVYVSDTAAAREDIQIFVNYYLDNAGELAGEVGYVALPEKAYELARQRFNQKITGSVFADKHSTVGLKLEDLLAIQ